MDLKWPLRTKPVPPILASKLRMGERRLSNSIMALIRTKRVVFTAVNCMMPWILNPGGGNGLPGGKKRKKKVCVLEENQNRNLHMVFSSTCGNGRFPATASSTTSHIQIFMRRVSKLLWIWGAVAWLTGAASPSYGHLGCTRASEKEYEEALAVSFTLLAVASGIAPFSARQEIHTVMAIYSKRKKESFPWKYTFPGRQNSLMRFMEIFFSFCSAMLAFSLSERSVALDCSMFLHHAFSLLLATKPFPL